MTTFSDQMNVRLEGHVLIREYVDMDKRRFIATDMGKVVNTFLTQHFPQYVDYDFTAQLEDALDEVSRGEKDWLPLMREFWVPFSKLVKEKENLTRSEVAQARELGADPKSGRPVSVRMGRYGPFVQIGTRDDEDKPKFAGLRPGQKMDAIDLDQALELFKLPRVLGATEKGEPVSASIGRFGPYIKYGDKFVSLRDEDPYTIALPRALELIAEKKIADANRLILDFEDAGIQVLNGRYGPYITDKAKNARVPKDRDPKSLMLEECVELLAAAPARRKKGGKKKPAKKTAQKKKAKKKAKKKTRKGSAKRKSSKKTRKKAAAKKSAAGQADADPF